MFITGFALGFAIGGAAGSVGLAFYWAATKKK